MGRVEACSAAVPVDEALAAVAGRVKVGLPVEKVGPEVKGVQPQRVIVRVRAVVLVKDAPMKADRVKAVRAKVVPLVAALPVRVVLVEADRAVAETSISIRWSA